jgi:hypothetical protein
LQHYRSAAASARIHYVTFAEELKERSGGSDTHEEPLEKLFDIRWQRSKGRHMVAVQDIEPG